MPVLSIVRPGMVTTVQDLGRWGFQSRGVPVSGAMDRYSHRLANRLIGNRDHDATLEVTMTGPQLECDEAVMFAVTGAVFDLALNGAAVAMNQSIEAPGGSILTFGTRRKGARAYLAVSGGVDVPQVLGSRSTHVLTRMGGLDGRALRAGDRIATKKGTGPFLPPLTGQEGSRPLFLPDRGARLRVIPGEPPLFSHLSARRFQVSPRSDRLGYRVDGPVSAGGLAADLISSAVPAGAVQLPPAGQPIMLMADHATTGGYAIGATIITADLPLAGQLAPGDWIEFEPCTLEDADRAMLELEGRLGAA